MRYAHASSKLARAAAPLVIGLICVGLSLGGDGARELLRYERPAFADFELWRIATAHLVHMSLGHTLLNVAALAVIAILLDKVLDTLDWIVATSVSAIAIDLGLYAFNPNVAWYVGLSGALHGIMVVGALALIVARARLGAVLLLLVIAKIAWERWTGPMPFSVLTSGGPVVTEAHLYGAIGGAVAFAALYWIRGSRFASL